MEVDFDKLEELEQVRHCRALEALGTVARMAQGDFGPAQVLPTAARGTMEEVAEILNGRKCGERESSQRTPRQGVPTGKERRATQRTKYLEAIAGLAEEFATKDFGLLFPDVVNPTSVLKLLADKGLIRKCGRGLWSKASKQKRVGKKSSESSTESQITGNYEAEKSRLLNIQVPRDADAGQD